MTTVAPTPTPAEEPAVIDAAAHAPLRDMPRVWMGLLRKRVSEGEVGILPVLLGLVLIAVVFQVQNGRFLTAGNLSNLMSQVAAMGTIAVGVVLVLLLGEIDLSVGSVSGVCAALMAVINVKEGMPAVLAVAVAVVSGTAIGLFQGFWSTRLHVPAFIVTLAGLIGWQGVQLFVLGDTGTLNLNDPFLGDIANRHLAALLGWAMGAGLVAVYVVASLRTYWRRTRSGLVVGPFAALVARMVVVGGGSAAAIGIMNADRGVPMGVLIFLAFVIGFDLMVQRTRFGRTILAVGGNAEAARRAGVNVDRIRVAVFALASTLAACGGILGASRLYAVNQSSGSGDLLLNAIAAAVIGGTSLFGGRGRPRNALLGALVLGAIQNGMNLQGYSSSIRYMVTGGVLLVAATIDAAARRGREAAGRA